MSGLWWVLQTDAYRWSDSWPGPQGQAGLQDKLLTGGEDVWMSDQVLKLWGCPRRHHTTWHSHKYTLVKWTTQLASLSIVSIIGQKAQAAPHQASPMQVKASTLYKADFSDKCDSFVIRVTTCCLHRIIIKALSALLPPSSTMISAEEENICLLRRRGESWQTQTVWCWSTSLETWNCKIY